MDISARPEDHVITSEEEFDRLPQTVKMRAVIQAVRLPDLPDDPEAPR